MQFIESTLRRRASSMGMSYADVDIADVASRTEGCVFHDLELLADRAIHFAVMDRMQTHCK